MTRTLEITEQTTLGELVTFFPAITPRLNALQIDYCCQGDRSLQTAMQETGLAADFLNEIQQAYQQYLTQEQTDVPVSESSDQELIDLILSVHHVPERALWKELDELVNKILLVHFKHDPERLLALHRCFSLLKMELEQHFAKEEKILFPALRLETKSEADLDKIKSLIAELEDEHDAAGQLIKQIIELTGHFTPPDYACPTVKVVYAKLHELVDDVFLHIAKENSVLFKRYTS